MTCAVTSATYSFVRVAWFCSAAPKAVICKSESNLMLCHQVTPRDGEKVTPHRSHHTAGGTCAALPWCPTVGMGPCRGDAPSTLVCGDFLRSGLKRKAPRRLFHNWKEPKEVKGFAQDPSMSPAKYRAWSSTRVSSSPASGRTILFTLTLPCPPSWFRPSLIAQSPSVSYYFVGVVEAAQDPTEDRDHGPLGAGCCPHI